MINKFYILDVFAEKRFAGNQLAVLVATEGTPVKEMQSIAREFNFSETTFVLSETPRDGGYDVRIFTPESEIPFAGHPTLGTAFVIQQDIIGEPVEEVVLNLGVGPIPVSFNYADGALDRLVMKQNEPVFGASFHRGAIAEVLGLSISELDARRPVQEVSTGLPFIIVPLKGLEALRSIKVNRNSYFELIEDAEAKAIVVFAPESYTKGNDLSVRMFADYYGIPEDPATGSGCGCLAAYLAKYRYFGKERVSVRAEQGHEIGRPSLLYLDAHDRNGQIDVHVGGRVIKVASGTLE